MKHNELIERYNLNEGELFILFDDIVSFLKGKSVNINFINLEPIVETDIYKVDKSFKDEEKHHETCISDGADVFMHNDIDDIGGIGSRLYDILHVGCGHLWQWSSNKQSGLKYYGGYSWKIASRFYLGADEKDLETVWGYEREAGIIAVANLKLILKNKNFNEEFKKNVVRFFNDYMNTDLKYITDFYKTGTVKDILEEWQFDSPLLPEIDLNFPIHISRRSNKCIALIK